MQHDESHEVCVYSSFGSILVHCGGRKDIDYVQLHRFLKACFAFSKWFVSILRVITATSQCSNSKHIQSHFHGLRVLAINGSLCCIVSISTNQLPVFEEEIMCRILLYTFETAYATELKTLHNEEAGTVENMMQNYSVHNIDNDNKRKQKKGTAIFRRFECLIQKSMRLSAICNAEIFPSHSETVLLSTSDESKLMELSS